jgi:chromatin segregation and condensation protein Rec8/ScpA/Scc1 (kleisin family)
MLALLELVKQQRVTMSQGQMFGPIEIERLPDAIDHQQRSQGTGEGS